MRFQFFKSKSNSANLSEDTSPNVSHNANEQSESTVPSVYESSDGIPRARGRRLTAACFEEESKYRALIKHLYARLTANRWLPSQTHDARCYGVFLRNPQGAYISQPEQPNPVLLTAVQKINMEVVFTMATDTTSTILSSLTPQQARLFLPNGSQVQVYPSLAHMAFSPSSAIKKYQYAALIRKERILLIWHDKLDSILVHAAAVESKLLALICNMPAFSLPLPAPARRPATRTSGTSATQSLVTSPAESTVHLVPEWPTDAMKAPYGPDKEAGKPAESLDRPHRLTSSIFVGMGLCLMIVLVVGTGVSNIVFQIRTDGNYIRAALVASMPIFLLFSLFFGIVIFTNLFQALGPIKGLRVNTRFHSAVRPNLARAYAEGFQPPRITIQMPVYTESLTNVIIPTITSLKAAIAHYEYHRGSATILVNDDGLAYMTEEEQQERIRFYRENHISWVARPKNNSECGYIRKGRFKKASNMNFALNVANKVEDALFRMLEGNSDKPILIDRVEEEAYYNQALSQVLESDSRIKAGGDIRIGEHILIVDSDTRVPEDCLLYSAAEMFLSPEVAILQHSTGVMQVSWDYFENGITFFTNLIYSAIRFSVGSGEVAPFVGHNAFLRWKAIQSVSQEDEDGFTAYWSESHVSEDFDIALRLQVAGDTVRLASYHNDEFKEGVSLTIYDELTRWEKYAYGCNELVFNPIHTWPWRSPFTKLFRTFLMSRLQLSSKLAIIGYISSYYAIASGFPLTTLNYFLVGWFNGYLDKYYIQSWKILLSVLVVFSLLGNICLAVMRYRLSEKPLLSSLLENFKWLPMLLVFFGGLSFHLSRAILAHMFSIGMRWTTTAKEKDNSNIFKEMPKIFRRFKWMYAVVLPLIVSMVYLGCFAPKGWEIDETIAVVPMAITLAEHALLPLVLNPSLMVFNY